MARVIGPLDLIGALDGFSFYRVNGQTFIRRKGGISKERYRKDPAFANMRARNTEFSGCVLAAQWVYRGLAPLKSVMDPHVFGRLVKLMKSVQSAETAPFPRPVVVSGTRVLDGFELTRKVRFNSVVPYVGFTTDREAGVVTVEVPRLVPGLTWLPARGIQYYRLMAVVAVVPDIHYTKKRYEPCAPESPFAPALPVPVAVGTDWHEANKTLEAGTLELRCGEESKEYSLVVAVGLQCGIWEGSGVRPMNGTCGMVLGVVGNELIS